KDIAPPALPGEEDDDDRAPFSRRRGFRTASALEEMPTDGAKKADQSVTVEWVCPAHIRVKQPFTCELVVRNNGTAPAMNVIVRNSSPEAMKVIAAEPKAQPDGGMMVWSLGNLEPKSERRIRLEMVAEKRGETTCNATVSVTTPTTSKVKVTEPQLVIKQTAPEKAMSGDQVPITMTVSNPGDGPTEPVILKTKIADGLKSDKGQDVMTEVGVLAAGETRVVKIMCTTVKGGSHKVMTTASCDGGLTCSAESTTSINEAKLEIAMEGPKLRYLDRAATYKVVVSNPGDAAAADVKVSAVVPAGFKVAGQVAGGKYDYATRTVSWTVGNVAPGEKKEIIYKCIATQVGEYKHLASAESGRGMKAQTERATKVEGIASLLMEIVDVDDPIEVGAETSYEVRVTNQGSREATNIEVRALVPREMAVKGGQGPTQHKVENQEIIFAPLPRLAPRADAIFRVFVKGVAASDVRFRARLVSDALTEPVIIEEGTKIYSDEKQ
ncbi:MAG TPA: hypothetical protein VNC50_08765, partial [Planctomycetia bacterium]|nr:hypothetical protein [Planctomycetia bacterium]